jgi:hypothetical protein
MPYLLSEDFVRNKLGRLMAGRDERLFRDTKLTGFALRVRRTADGTTFAKDWFALQPQPGKDAKGNQKNPKKITIGNHPTFDADKARTEAQGMLQAVKRGDDPAAERAAKKEQPRWEDLLAAFRAKIPAEETTLDAQALRGCDQPHPDASVQGQARLRHLNPDDRGHVRKASPRPGRRQQRVADAVENDELRNR